MIKAIEIKLYSKLDFTDCKLIEFRNKKGLTIKEYTKYLTESIIENENSFKIIDFISNFEKGILLPDKCDVHEPIKEAFDKANLTDPVSWLSQPGGALFLKKNKGIKYVCEISNKRFAPIWSDEILQKPKVSEPEYLSEVFFYFYPTKTLIKPLLQNFLEGLKKILETDKAEIEEVMP